MGPYNGKAHRVLRCPFAPVFAKSCAARFPELGTKRLHGQCFALSWHARAGPGGLASLKRESFRDPGIAERINRGLIRVKPDRGLHPALGYYLIGFVERTAGQVDWPLNVFLMPDGYPSVS